MELRGEPPMPTLQSKWLHPKYFKPYGICLGSGLRALILRFSTPKGPALHYLVVYAWRGMYPIIAKLSLDDEFESIWIDHDQDNIADEYYYDLSHFQLEYGSGTWLCAALKQLL